MRIADLLDKAPIDAHRIKFLQTCSLSQIRCSATNEFGKAVGYKSETELRDGLEAVAE
jgi:hypothetical protein